MSKITKYTLKEFMEEVLALADDYGIDNIVLGVSSSHQKAEDTESIGVVKGLTDEYIEAIIIGLITSGLHKDHELIRAANYYLDSTNNKKMELN